MSRFSDIKRQPRATRTISLPVPGGEDVSVAVQVLTGREFALITSRASEYATALGAKDPKPGVELYDLGVMVHTLLLGCVASDDHTTPFFSSADEILDGLDTDRIALLYEEQVSWQDECAPRPGRMGDGEFFATVLRFAGWKEGQPDPFPRLRPYLRLSFTHTLAAQYVTLLSQRSESSSPSVPTA